ncbi:DUF2341 domain-containing protein, partial [Methanoregula sp.]|uniref:DUF2341 domain-containing protein n=1 Tax=Methanoregula sp. TaxID=2052170 RepID=UPI00236BC614
MKCYPVRVPGCLSVAQNRSSNTPATPARRGLAAGRWHRFILIGLLVALTVLAVPVAAATIDTGSFTSKYTANIHGAATDLTDYQVKFVLYNVTGLDSSENIHLPGIAQPTFNDVRFALSDGTELSYWMETPTGTDNAIFWVKIPSIPAGYANTVPVDIYYGNPTIGSAADGAATFALFDDFEGSSLNTDKWTVSSGTGYSVSDSKLRLTGTTKLQSNTKFSQNASIGFRGNLYQYIQYLGFQDYAITSDYVQFRVINSYQETFYKKINSVATNYALSSLYGYYWNINEYRTGEMTWNSTHITVTDRVNPRYTNEAALSATLPVYVASQISSVGYYSYYDWIFVRQLADSEPVVNEPAGSVVTGTPDLTINSVSSPTPRIANIVTATIVNLGTGDAGAFKANFTLNGTPSTFDITSLAAGSSTTISVTDPIASRVLGDTIPLTITLDTENALAETDETNNTYSTPLTVVRGGSYGSGYYLGGRYYTGYDLETGNFTEGNVTVVSALGSGYQTDGGWYSTTAQWSADTLPVPATATVRSARLYQSYTWSNNDNPGLAVQFNGNTVDQVAFYGDGPIYSPNYNGQAVYDVTPYFNKDGNTALITASAPSGGLYGAVLVVVYEDTSEPYRKIWLDEGCDTLYGATDESHIAYAMFNNVTTAGVSSAKVMTILPSGNDNNQNSIRFDAQSAALIGSGGADPAFRYYDVTDALHDGTNELGVTYDGSYINLAAAILELTYEAPPSASFSANATSGTAPVSVQFTDLSYGATGWQWDFNNDGTIDSTEKNPVYTYTAAGTFTVNLTATNAYGSATESKTAYITVTGAEATSGPVVAFTATPVSGTWPLAVQFTDESAGTITARSWDFGDYSTPSAEQNPLHTYTTAGTYNVTLSATSADGTNTTVKKNLVTVSPVTGSRLLLANTKNGTVSGDLYVGSFQPVPFADQPTSDDVTVRDFDQRFAIPTFTNIQWARLYVNVYSGSGSANWPSRTTISLDGNGDGTYET